LKPGRVRAQDLGPPTSEHSARAASIIIKASPAHLKPHAKLEKKEKGPGNPFPSLAFTATPEIDQI
jgi:hypothetical protein